MTNTNLDLFQLPDFANLSAADVVPVIEEILASNRQKIESLLDADSYNFDDLIEPLEDLNHRLQCAWSPVTHMQMISNESAWREAHANTLPLVTEYATELAQNARLYKAFTQLEKALPSSASEEQKSLIEHTLRNFHKAGVGLSGEDKQRFREVMSELAGAATKFAQNLQDATDAWQFLAEDETMVAGLPSTTLSRAAARAAAEKKKGWLFTLDMPTYLAVMTHASDGSLRKIFYEAWVTRASDAGPLAGEFDNQTIIDQLLRLRHEAARLVDFPSYAAYSLDGRMAASVDEVLGFLNDLTRKSRSAAEAELRALEQFARQPIQAWDVAYYSEKLKDARFEISDARLRPYFPADRAISGLFELAKQLYGISVCERDDVSLWHDSVLFFEVQDSSGSALGGFYADLYARDGKHGGAWIDECVVRKSFAETSALPVGYLVCNFSPPQTESPSLLTHGEVVTLFHEFGHMLHHLLTRVGYPSIAGINGVPWDAVELPSQFMENFAWDRAALNMASGHYETGEPLPDDIFENLLASRRFNAGLQMLRQIEFALFDFRLHAEYDANDPRFVDRLLQDVRQLVAMVPVPDWNRFPNSFSHIFSGGYAAGYYSYKWAEVLAADAFSALDMSHGLDHRAAQRFRRSILEVGGSRDILAAFIEFRGREPRLNALLEVSGIGAH